MRRLEGHFGGSFDSSSCSLLKLPGVSHFRLDTLGSLWFHPLFSCLLRRQCYQDQQGSGGQGSNYFHSLSCWEGSWESNGRPACHSWMKSHTHANLGCCWGGRGLFETAHRCPRPRGEVYGSDVTWGFLSTMEGGLQPWKIKVGVEACATTFKLI